MSTKKTEHLKLHGWEPFDAFMREEFNENFDKIDAAVKSDRAGITAAQNTADSALSKANTAQSTVDALSRTVTENKSQTDAAKSSADAALAALTSAVGSGGKTCRIAYGEYAGNNEVGKDKAKTLYFDFKPYYVAINCFPNYNAMEVGLVRNCNNFKFGTFIMEVIWGENSVSYYSTVDNPGYQMNMEGLKYYYVAFGF